MKNVFKSSLLETSEFTSLFNRSKIVPTISDLINCEDYSSLPKLLRVTAYVMQFVKVQQRKSLNEQMKTNFKCYQCFNQSRNFDCGTVMVVVHSAIFAKYSELQAVTVPVGTFR